jgi:hypothetical protein
MGEAQKRFNEATNQVDRAYWQGALDGERAEHERIASILERERNHWETLFEESDGYDSNVGSRYGGALTAIDDLTALIKGEN